MFHDIPDFPNNQKTEQKKPQAITVFKKRGRVLGGMIMITDSMFFFKPSLSHSLIYDDIPKKIYIYDPKWSGLQKNYR